jgi:hypothetical protein
MGLKNRITCSKQEVGNEEEDATVYALITFPHFT